MAATRQTSAQAAKPRAKSTEKPRSAATGATTRRVVAAGVPASGGIDPQGIARELGITKSDLAETLGLPADALLRAERIEADKTQAKLSELLEILGRVEPWCGSRRAAFAWYRGQGIAALGDETAEAMVKTNRAGLVRTYLNAIAAGSFA